jgi:ABC-type transport system involved in Fe-S cluster assembly fused permease/ATPase subunit
MKNRFIRVTLVTLIIYIIYTFFFIDEMIDVPLDKNSISIESKGLENKIDSIFSDKDSVFEINKE